MPLGLRRKWITQKEILRAKLLDLPVAEALAKMPIEHPESEPAFLRDSQVYLRSTSPFDSLPKFDKPGNLIVGTELEIVVEKGLSKRKNHETFYFDYEAMHTDGSRRDIGVTDLKYVKVSMGVDKRLQIMNLES